MTENDNKRWRKILYEDQGVPDNYVDESFLDEMKKNCTCDTLDFSNNFEFCTKCFVSDHAHLTMLRYSAINQSSFINGVTERKPTIHKIMYIAIDQELCALCIVCRASV